MEKIVYNLLEYDDPDTYIHTREELNNMHSKKWLTKKKPFQTNSAPPLSIPIVRFSQWNKQICAQTKRHVSSLLMPLIRSFFSFFFYFFVHIFSHALIWSSSFYRVFFFSLSFASPKSSLLPPALPAPRHALLTPSQYTEAQVSKTLAKRQKKFDGVVKDQVKHTDIESKASSGGFSLPFWHWKHPLATLYADVFAPK